MYRELRQAAANAPDGQVISMAESLAIARGRELARQSLETVLQAEIEVSEKKGLPAEPATAAAGARTAANKRADSSRRQAP
jgi:hypothetical protein